MQVKLRHTNLPWYHVKLTVDCVLNHDLAHLPSSSALSLLLAKGKVNSVDMPLEALICQQYGLSANADYPIAAISAAADGLDVGHAFWLRSDPVHFEMQRDCFSLSEPAPLVLKAEQARLMLTSLNEHFSQDGLAFYLGESGAWYLRTEMPQQIQTTLPSVAMDKNVHHFMPQGQDSAKWKAILNEVQMLLHDHPVNQAREASGEVVVNSIWLSGGGAMPSFESVSHDADFIIANEVFKQGLAQWVGIRGQRVPTNVDEVLQLNGQNMHLTLPHASNLDGIWFTALLAAVKGKKIQQLRLNLACYDKTLTVEIKPLNFYKFWRKSYAMMHYLNEPSI